MTKKKLTIKINNVFKYWSFLCFLRTNGILIFAQSLTLNALEDLMMYISFKDRNYKWKFLNKGWVKQLVDKKFLIKTKNFKNILILNSINDLDVISQTLIKNNILILGYYIQNIFFFKKDFHIKKIDKKNIYENLKKRIINFFILKKNILLNIKRSLMRFILLLKKRI